MSYKTLFKTFLSLIIVGALASFAFAQSDVSIVPQPNSLKRLSGEFKLSSRTKIFAGDEAARQDAALLNDFLQKQYGFKLEVAADKPPKKHFIAFSHTGGDATKDSYRLTVTKRSIQISAGDGSGQFYALQTLFQLFPTRQSNNAIKIPAVEIADAPRFAYRGMHLDVGRHFFSIEFLKKYLDLMSQYKLNRFHWHLTEDQGWRIEIKKYPRLTEISAFRRETIVGRQAEEVNEKNIGKFKFDGQRYGGFYTQEQVKEIVAYAKSRHIMVIPEVELPGHSVAAIAAYPELGCGDPNKKYEPLTYWGVSPNIYCPKEETFKFLENVLSEVVALFPDSPYIHIGGDEAPKDAWKASPLAQEVIKREGLKDEHELQSYFIRRIEKFLNSKGKRIIGWDEILEGGLAPNATVMSWRGTSGGIAAAKQHHDVIMTPTDYAYFDYNQGDMKNEPISIGGFLPLERAYSYDPMPKELAPDEQKHILGVQANMWTEYLKTPEQVEYMLFPRMLALAENAWTRNEHKNYDLFLKRLPHQLAILDRLNVKYRIPEPDGLPKLVVTTDDKVTLNLSTLAPGGKIYYTLDGSVPTAASTAYIKPFEVKLDLDKKVPLNVVVVSQTGRSSVVFNSLLWRRSLLPAVEYSGNQTGVSAVAFDGQFNKAAKVEEKLSQISPTEWKPTTSFALEQFGKKETFAVVFDGYLNAPADGIYEFATESDDGSVLMIDGERIVDNDGYHSSQKVSGFAPLKKGFHRVRVIYFQGWGSATLNVFWAVKGQPLQPLDAALMHR